MAVAVRNTENDIVETYWKTLRTLSVRAKLKLASLLTAAAFEEESRRGTALHSKETRKVIRRATATPSDAELEARSSGKEMPIIPDDPSWSQVIDSNTGKTIQPIEKWL
jgi:hypothetical protein